jgi:hypothetical protein
MTYLVDAFPECGAGRQALTRRGAELRALDLPADCNIALPALARASRLPDPDVPQAEPYEALRLIRALAGAASRTGVIRGTADRGELVSALPCHLREALAVGGASGVPDKQRAHGAPPILGPPLPQDSNSSGIGQCPTPPARATHAASASSSGRNGIVHRNSSMQHRWVCSGPGGDSTRSSQSVQ